jgi:succinate-semialdehyde dehydrogenase / glutarate-semialdehyde dehydrogenase
VISPWNYPLTLSASDALPAIAAGNAVVMKVDSKTPFCGLSGLALLEEAGLPRDVLQVVTGSGAELGPELIGRVDYIMFTGSTATGRQVAAQAAERLIPSSMELGGKNAMLVLADASVRRAVEGAERAMFSNAGQLCISIERLYVHESTAPEFLRRLVARVGRMRLGAGLSYGYDMGSLISQEQLDAVRSHVDDAVAAGAAVLCGGRARPDIGPYFYEPTLLADVRPDMSLFADETFGPVVAVSTFTDEDDAVAQANEGSSG